MSQFPQVNVIDPVSPQTMQSLGLVSQNQNALKDRELEAEALRQRGRLAQGELNQRAMELDAETTMGQMQLDAQKEAMERQSEDTRYTADVQRDTWLDQHATEKLIAEQKIAADKERDLLMMQDQDRRDKAANTLTLERDRINARQARAVAGAQADFKQREMLVRQQLAEIAAQGAIMEDEKLRLAGQRPGVVAHLEKQLRGMVGGLKKGEELGQQAADMGFQEMGTAMGDITDLNTYDMSGRGGLNRTILKNLGAIEEYLGDTFPMVIQKKPSTGVLREVYTGGDEGEGYEQATPEAVAGHLAKGFARGAAMVLVDGLGIQNQAAVEGSLTNILQASMVANTVADADPNSTDDQHVGESKKLYANVLEKELANLEEMGVPRQAVAQIIDKLADSTSNELSTLKQQENTIDDPDGSRRPPTAQEKLRITTMANGVEKIRKSVLMAKTGLTGKVMRGAEVEELREILLDHWTRNTPIEEVETILGNEFELNPDYAEEFVRAMMKRLNPQQLQQLLGEEKSIEDRARALARRRTAVEMAGADFLSDAAGSAEQMAPFQQQEDDITALLERYQD